MKGLDNSRCEYAPTTDALLQLGVQLCTRIVRLDRLRGLAAKNVDFCLGFVELGHLVCSPDTFLTTFRPSHRSSSTCC